MYKVFVLTLLLCGWSSMGFLYGQQAPGTLPVDTLVGRETRFWTQRLALGLEQQPGVRQAMQAYFEGLANLGRTVQDTAVRNHSIRQIRQQQQDALREVFTPAQWTTYEAVVQERHDAFLQRTRQRNVAVKELDQN